MRFSRDTKTLNKRNEFSVHRSTWKSMDNGYSTAIVMMYKPGGVVSFGSYCKHKPNHMKWFCTKIK